MDCCCPFKPRTKTRRQSACHKLAERHPVCFWVTWTCAVIVALLTAFGLNENVNWKIFAYSVFILGCIIFFIAVAIVHLSNFGKELQVEFQGAICGQINRYDRPVRQETCSLNQVLITPSHNVKGGTRKASSVSFKTDPAEAINELHAQEESRCTPL